LSRGFIAALAGIAMTLFAWFGQWSWPAWPAFTAISLVFGKAGFSELPYAQKSITVVSLILLNSAFWAALVYAILWSGGRLGRRRRAGARDATREA